MKTLYTLLLITFTAAALYGQQKEIKAYYTKNSPEIDGYLNDDCWQKAETRSDFLQQEPEAGAEPTMKTSVTIVYDDDNLYVGIMCYDPEPDKIIAREMGWDGKMSGDDHVTMIFDTFNDDRNAYWFGTNPLGMHDDALMSGVDFSGFNESWNGIWDVRGAITDSGWSVELIFPFSTLKFSDDPQQVWGVNFQRNVRRTGETMLWTSVGRDLGMWKISKAGDLTGLHNLKRGDPIYLKPFLSGGMQRGTLGDDDIIKTGLDIKYGITNTLSLDLTFNTDFAQIESDREVINLTRFPQYFPEKRDFFLEGSRVFDFSFGGPNEVFYSRRIGLKQGEEIPIIGGAKLVGRVNGQEIGVISMQTGEKGTEPLTNYTVLRMKQDIFEQSYAGVIFTSKYDGEHFNQVYGADIGYRTNEFLGDKYFEFGANIAMSNQNSHPDSSLAGKIYFDYPNDFLKFYGDYRFIQNNFNPEVGFLRRQGVQHLTFLSRIMPRIDLWEFKQLFFAPIETQIELNSNNEMIGAYYGMQLFGITTQEGDRLHIEAGRNFDKVPFDYPVFDNYVIRAGEYWYTGLNAEIHTSSGRDVYGEIEFSTGEFYDGWRNNAEIELTVTPSKHIRISGDYEYNIIELGGGSFETNAFGARINYDFNTLLHSSVFAQWNNEMDLMILNYRLNWQPEIGSNFYFVVNQVLDTEHDIQSKDIAVIGKFVWLFTL